MKYNISTFICLLILSISYWLFTFQSEFVIAILVHYILGFIFLKKICKISNAKAYFTFNVFFFIYGLLVLFSHIELIKDPFEDFYVHNDASLSFYSSIVNVVDPQNSSWGELPQKTIFNVYFADYLLASYIWSVIAKLGYLLGIENIRLLLRLHCFLVAALSMAIITDYVLNIKTNIKQPLEYVFAFGIGTYIYIAAAIFSRDIFLTFFMTYAVYKILINNKRTILLLLILGLIGIGYRVISGLCIFSLMILYIVNNKPNNFKIVVCSCICLLIFISFYFENSIVSDQIELYNRYQQHNAELTKGGLFYKFYTLPFPLDKIAMSVYMMLQPLPITFYIVGEGHTLLNIPEILSPYIIVYIIFAIAYALVKNVRMPVRVRHLSLLLFAIYIIIISGSPDIRRAFIVMPGLFMIFLTIESGLPNSVTKSIKFSIWIIVFAIQLFFYVYTS